MGCVLYVSLVINRHAIVMIPLCKIKKNKKIKMVVTESVKEVRK